MPSDSMAMIAAPRQVGMQEATLVEGAQSTDRRLYLPRENVSGNGCRNGVRTDAREYSPDDD